MSRNRRGILSTGITSILMVFMILCLVTFAVLALTSARADLKYSEQTAARTAAYYEAELRANRKLKVIDEELCAQYNMDKENWKAGDEILFLEQIDETALLEVAIQVLDPGQADGKMYRIKRWQTAADEEWNPDMTLPVMQ